MCTLPYFTYQCKLNTHDPNFNKGHGEKFYKAFEIALKRGDFKK